MSSRLCECHVDGKKKEHHSITNDRWIRISNSAGLLWIAKIKTTQGYSITYKLLAADSLW